MTDGLAFLWFFVPFHCQPDQPGKVCRWASALSECSPVWRLSGKYCDSWSCARSCLMEKWHPCGQNVSASNGFVMQIVGKHQGGILLVTATCLFDLPSSIVSMTSSGLQTNLSVQPFKEKQDMKLDYLPSQTGLTSFLTRDTRSHLDVGYSVFVFMHWQIGLWHWRWEEKGVMETDVAYWGYTILIFTALNILKCKYLNS